MLLAIGGGFVWVIRLEYHLGARLWPWVLALGIGLTLGSALLPSFWGSALLGILAGSIVWGATELPDQEKRVAQGLFPENPNRRAINPPPIGWATLPVALITLAALRWGRTWAGTVLAVTTFATIGFGHVLVRRLHARFGTRPGWPLIALGLALLAYSATLPGDLPSAVVGITAITVFWDGVEIFRQKKRMQHEARLQEQPTVPEESQV